MSMRISPRDLLAVSKCIARSDVSCDREIENWDSCGEHCRRFGSHTTHSNVDFVTEQEVVCCSHRRFQWPVYRTVFLFAYSEIDIKDARGLANHLDLGDAHGYHMEYSSIRRNGTQQS